MKLNDMNPDEALWRRAAQVVVFTEAALFVFVCFLGIGYGVALLLGLMGGILLTAFVHAAAAAATPKSSAAKWDGYP